MSGEGGEGWGGGRQQGGKPTGGDEGGARGERGGRRRWHSQGKADGGAMLPVELSSAPGEGLSSGLVIPQGAKVPSGAPVGKDVEEAQELPVNLRPEVDMAQGRKA